MSTLWVSVSGTDTNSGTNYTLAKKTVYGAIGAASKGDVINVVNDGTHTLGDFVDLSSQMIDGDFAGTNYDTDPGLTIQGTDSSGNPAMTHYQASVDGGTQTYFVRFNGGSSFTTVRGFKLDYSTVAGTVTSANSLRPIYAFNTVGSARFFDLEFLYSTDVGSSVNITTNTNPLESFYWRTAHNGNIEIARCLFINARFPLPAMQGAQFDMHNNIVFSDCTSVASVAAAQQASGGTPTAQRFRNNTLIQRRYGAALAPTNLVDSTNDTAVLGYYNNLVYTEAGSNLGGGSPGIDVALKGAAVAAQTTPSGTMAYDLFAWGPYATAAIPDWASANGYASYQFDPIYRGGGSNTPNTLPTNSTEVTAATYADVFNDATAAWTWTPDDYSHDLPFDMRPIVGRTAASDGGVVGAVTAAIIQEVPPTESDAPAVADLDSAPFYRPVLRADAWAQVRIRRNQVRDHVDFRHYLKREVWNEFTSRIVTVGDTASTTITLAGVADSKAVMLQTDQQMAVTVVWNTSSGTDSFQATVNGCLMMDQVGISQLNVSNTSSTTANVHLSVFE